MVGLNKHGKLDYARQVMIESHLKGRNITDSSVLDTMRQVPRESFVANKYFENAYDDNPLPIGMGQTISQPYIVALMTQHLLLNKDHIVLEIGTGCGYQTAILATLAEKVYTVERYNELSEMAQNTLAGLGIGNVEFYIGDGSKGWPDNILFDRVIITAAVPDVPKPVVNQLKEGGIIVVPVGNAVCQELIAYKKTNSNLKPSLLCGCRFVKLVGEYGFDED